MLYKNHHLLFWLIICFIAVEGPLSAQINPIDSSKINQDSLRLVEDLADDEQKKPLGDTTSVHYYYLNQPEVYFAIDTSLNNFEYPKWELGQSNDNRSFLQSDLGHLGSPIFPLLWSAETRAGFRVGLESFQKYRLLAKDIPYYEVGGKKPYTDLSYSQISLQNVVLNANFAHQATPELYYSIHYDILNYNGYFEGHRSRHQNIALSLRYQKGKYIGYFTGINSAINQSENGGLLSNTLDSTLTLFLSTLPVALNVESGGSPKWENRHQNISYQQFLRNGKTDSLGNSKKASSEFGHRIQYEANRYKYFDKDLATDSSFYQNFQTNSRGVRNYMLHLQLENELSYRFALGGDFQKAPLVMKAYVLHKWHRVLQEPALFNIHNFAAGAEIYDQLHAAFSYRAEGYATNSRLGLDFWIKGQVGFKLKDWIEIQGKTLFQRYEPAQMARQLYVSQSLIWDNSSILQQTQELSISGTLAWPKWWGQFEFSNHTISSPVYFDTLARAAQLNGSANILQLRLRQDLHVWRIHLENEAIWQPVLAGAEIFRLPELILRHKLYYEGPMFKTIKFRAGAALRYMSSFQTNAYFPLTGQFHLQDNQVLSFYPVVDLFLSLKIWQLRFFVNAENLTYFLNRSQNYYTAPNYPTPNWFIRFGASWQLFD
jgi:hypothetical protein